jgi:hypothetical protein
MKRVLFRILILSVAAAAGIAWAALRICGSCGHEAEGDETTCLHCGAALPAPASASGVDEPPVPDPEPAGDPAPGPGEPAVLPEGLLENQVEAARALADRGVWWGAMLYARNASAMAGLAGVPGATIQHEMERLQETARRAMADVTVPCASCEGTGRQRKLSIMLSGDVVEQAVEGAVCSVCQGTTTQTVRASQDRLQRDASDAQRHYDLAQRRRGLVAWQGVYLPEQFADRLEPRQVVALRKGFGVECEGCNGFRRVSCTTCKGAGHSPCTGGCVQGRMVCATCGGRGRTTETRTDRSTDNRSGTSRRTGRTTTRNTAQVRCASCNGIGIRDCEVCGGTALIRCRTCAGEKDTLCRVCQGSGTPAVCTRCRGDGIQSCTRCQGTGKGRRDEPCEYCNGRGEILCATCEGAGRGRR